MRYVGRNKSLRLLVEPYRGRPGSQVIHSFNDSLAKAGLDQVGRNRSPLTIRAGLALDKRGLVRNLFRLPGQAYLAALMWPRVARLFPANYFHEIIPFCFDCWPPDYCEWKRLFSRHRVRTVFFTARDSADYFQSSNSDISTFWMPEAADATEYTPDTPLVAREIDVLEYGRRWEHYHESITASLEAMGHNHLYSSEKRFCQEGNSNLRRYVFSNTEELRNGLGNTRISICFSKAVTHPDKAQNVDTVTFRYFESIASKCLIVGNCPSELRDLFGYTPIIEADLDDPAQQIHEILSDIGSYQSLVDRNYQRFLEVGTWDARALSIIELLEPLGYRP